MRNLLRSPVITAEIDDRLWQAPWAKRLRGTVGLAAVLLVAYGGVSLAGLFQRNPFQVAIGEACALGGWETDQVQLDRGHYAYRLLYSDVWAELLVDTPEGRRPVRIELRNDPLSGWRVRALEGRAVDRSVRLTSGP